MQTGLEITVERLTEDTLIVRFHPEISVKTSQRIQQLVRLLRAELASQLVDLIPSYTTLLVQYDIQVLNYEQLEKAIYKGIKTKHDDLELTTHSKLIQIPVCYDRSLALDAQEMEQQCKLPLDEIALIHTQKKYTVFAIGFCPAFAFLGNVDQAITKPRKSTPRPNVNAGSVAIANQQTTVYPMDSPGGWNIIGRSPMNLIDFSSATLCPFEVGDRVQFSAITLEEYHYLKEAQQ